jgi:hypothetical protein
MTRTFFNVTFFDRFWFDFELDKFRYALGEVSMIRSKEGKGVDHF